MDRRKSSEVIQLYRKFKEMTSRPEADVLHRSGRMHTRSGRRRYIYLFGLALTHLAPEEQQAILSDPLESLSDETLLKLAGLIQPWVKSYLVRSK